MADHVVGTDRIPAARRLRPHVRVDLGGTHPRRVPAADDDRLVAAGGGRLVALERHPDEIAVESERVDDLGRRRKQ
jgi:hypothetical protein